MSFLILLYRNILYPMLLFAAHFLAAKNQKIRVGIQLREPKNGIYPWLHFDKNTQPVWFHCSSGEFEYAKPLIKKIKLQNPQQKIIVTYFSPSSKTSIEKNEYVDFSCPTPWDKPIFLTEFIKHHRPKILLIARTDLWLEMLLQCKNHQIPSLLFSATLTSQSGRMKNFITRWYYSMLCTLITEIYCVSESDKDQFARLGAKEKTLVSGDTRFDQTLDRIENPKPLKEFLKPQQKTFIAGSTWPEDEEILLPTIDALIQNNISTILVPHEPDQKHLEKIEEYLFSKNIPFQKYSSANEFQSGVLIIDTIGILAELYLWSDIAFVGGSFKKSVHSVMEPLTCGLPVLTGPFIENNREATKFAEVESNGVYAVKICTDSQSIQKTIIDFCSNDAATQIHQDISNAVKKHAGATKRLYEHIAPLLIANTENVST